MSESIQAVSRIPIENAALLAPAIGLALLLVVRRWLGAWPDLWRFRRAVLPAVDRLADGEYDDELDVVDERVGVDLDGLAAQLPEKTGLRISTRTLVGIVDAPPAEVRAELREMDRVYPNTLASIQYDIDEETGERVWEVGSYAYRPEGFLGEWQYHVRLTPAAGGRKTRLWAHYERSAWRAPVRHYNGVGWDADRGVSEIASLFASDERFEASEQAAALIGSESEQ